MRCTTSLASLLAAAAGLPAVLAAPVTSVAIIVDTRDLGPLANARASAVLSASRPVKTTYLMGLASSTKARVSALVGSTPSKDAHIPIRIYRDNEKSESILIDADIEAAVQAATGAKAEAVHGNKHLPSTAQVARIEIPESLRMEAMPSHRRVGSEIPCAYAQMRREYNDMMVISLVAIFLLVIVAVELWDSNEQTADVEAAAEGAIKLGDDVVSEKQPLSVQASPVTVTTA